jgi:hypothetical protein
MNCLSRVMGRWAPDALPPAVASSDRIDFAQALADQRRILTRAAAKTDAATVAIREAMAHADEAFGPVERRRKPR